MCSRHYTARVDPLIITPVRRASAVWALASPVIPDALQRRIRLVQSDAELLPALDDLVPLDALPPPLRRRAMMAQLARRPSRDVLAARGVLAADDAAEDAAREVAGRAAELCAHALSPTGRPHTP